MSVDARARRRTPSRTGSCPPRGRRTGRGGRRARRPPARAAPRARIASASPTGRSERRPGPWRGGRDRRGRGRHRRAQTNRSRSASGTTAAVPSSNRMRPASRWVPARNRRRPARPSQRPSRPAHGPWTIADVDRVELGQVGRPRPEQEGRRVGRDADLAAGVGAQDREGRLGDRAAQVPVEDEHAERGGAMEARPLARLGRREVAPVLVRQGGDDDAPHAHGPGPAERLGVDPGVEDEDRARPADVDGPGPRLAVAGRGDLEPATGRAAERLDTEEREAGHVERQARSPGGPHGRRPRRAPRARPRPCRRPSASGRPRAPRARHPGPSVAPTQAPECHACARRPGRRRLHRHRWRRSAARHARTDVDEARLGHPLRERRLRPGPRRRPGRADDRPTASGNRTSGSRHRQPAQADEGQARGELAVRGVALGARRRRSIIRCPRSTARPARR